MATVYGYLNIFTGWKLAEIAEKNNSRYKNAFN